MNYCVCHVPKWMVKAVSTCSCIFQVQDDAMMWVINRHPPLPVSL